MSDNFDRKRKNISLTAIFIIILGIVFLLNNFGILPWEIWQNLWKFWPVLLILFGVESVIGKSSTPKALGLLLILIFLVPIILVLNPLAGNPLATKTEEFKKPLGNLTKANFAFDLSSNNLKITALESGSNDLFSGSLNYSQILPAPNLKEERRFDTAKYTISQEDSGEIPFSKNLGNSGVFKYSTLIPIEFSFKSNTGVFDFNFEKLKVTFIAIESSAGSIKINFAKDFSSRVFIKSTASLIKFKIPENLGASIKTDTTIKSLNLSEKRFAKNATGSYQTINYEKSANKVEIELTGSATNIEIN